jgi:hypothetical protein
MRKRNTSSDATDQASAAAPVARPNTRRVSAKTCRRPIRSASRPPRVAPSAIPTNPIEPIQESSVGVSDHWTASAAMTNEMRPTSIASRAQPRPEPTTSRPCSRVNGRRSSRWARVGEVVVASAVIGAEFPLRSVGHRRRRGGWSAALPSVASSPLVCGVDTGGVPSDDGAVTGERRGTGSPPGPPAVTGELR